MNCLVKHHKGLRNILWTENNSGTGDRPTKKVKLERKQDLRACQCTGIDVVVRGKAAMMFAW